MSDQIDEFLANNPNWVEIVKSARQRGYLSCSAPHNMIFVPVLGNCAGVFPDIGEDDLVSILRANSPYSRFCPISASDFLEGLLDNLALLRANKNALILLLTESSESSEDLDHDGYFYYKVVPLPIAVAT